MEKFAVFHKEAHSQHSIRPQRAGDARQLTTRHELRCASQTQCTTHISSRNAGIGLQSLDLVSCNNPHSALGRTWPRATPLGLHDVGHMTPILLQLRRKRTQQMQRSDIV
jgi:hypothetical protein